MKASNGDWGSAVIDYVPEAYTTAGPKLMGRNAAGESFLRGFLTYSRASEFWVRVADPAHARAFARIARSCRRSEPVKAVTGTALGALSKPGLVYHPGPGIGQYAWQRTRYGDAAWSLCGITHTTASARAMDALADLLVAPVQPWDALICTSTAVRDNVTRVLQAQFDHLARRLGATRPVLPELPVIPLGIHTEDFVYSDMSRAKARAALGADARTRVVLFVGRLSFHAKAHPLAMYQALQVAIQVTGEQVLLIECGWHANPSIQQAYADAARQACPDVRVVTLDGRDAGQRETAWAAADLFCSLADNLQETFGITPIEAMATGLPVVVSDWDGYKDTVRDGVDGFRVPTLMPPAGAGVELAWRHALGVDNYDMYCGHTCSLIAVDIEATASAFKRLFADPDLCRRLGESGRARAREIYDWRVIIPRYEALWADLAERRQAADAMSRQPLRHPWPARMDPFHAFASYPTRQLTAETRLELVAEARDDTGGAALGDALARLGVYRRLAMVNFAGAILPDEAISQALLEVLAEGPRAAGDLVRIVPGRTSSDAFCDLAWLVKLGIIKVCQQA